MLTYNSAECDDADICTQDWCEPYQGCRHEQSKNCTVPCTGSAACDDGSLCTEDMCNLPEQLCVHVDIVCDDSNWCTKDFCDPDHGCVHNQVAGCEYCEVGSDCANSSGNQCVTATCDPSDHRCVFVEKTCDDGDECTQDYCVAETGQCQNDWVCCEADTDCDPGNACTAGKCNQGTCVLTPIACTDGDPCTADSCDTDVGCVHEAVIGCREQAK